MAKLTLTLFPVGHAVRIVGLPFAGLTGRVLGHRHVGPDEPDTVHVVQFDAPVQVPRAAVERDGTPVIEPAHVVEQALVPASQLESI